MNKIKYYAMAFMFMFAITLSAQEQPVKEKTAPHGNVNKFEQMYQEFATPNTYRSASGAPGPDYYQQQADYKMDITLDDKNAKIFGEETYNKLKDSTLSSIKVEENEIQESLLSTTKDVQADLTNTIEQNTSTSLLSPDKDSDIDEDSNANNFDNSLVTQDVLDKFKPSELKQYKSIMKRAEVAQERLNSEEWMLDAAPSKIQKTETILKNAQTNLNKLVDSAGTALFIPVFTSEEERLEKIIEQKTLNLDYATDISKNVRQKRESELTELRKRLAELKL